MVLTMVSSFLLSHHLSTWSLVFFFPRRLSSTLMYWSPSRGTTSQWLVCPFRVRPTFSAMSIVRLLRMVFIFAIDGAKRALPELSLCLSLNTHQAPGYVASQDPVPEGLISNRIQDANRKHSHDNHLSNFDSLTLLDFCLLLQNPRNLPLYFFKSVSWWVVSWGLTHPCKKQNCLCLWPADPAAVSWLVWLLLKRLTHFTSLLRLLLWARHIDRSERWSLYFSYEKN